MLLQCSGAGAAGAGADPGAAAGAAAAASAEVLLLLPDRLGGSLSPGSVAVVREVPAGLRRRFSYPAGNAAQRRGWAAAAPAAAAAAAAYGGSLGLGRSDGVQVTADSPAPLLGTCEAAANRPRAA